MRNVLWTIFAIVGGIMGFLMGYATAPMIESGVLTGQGAKRATKIEAGKELEQFYKDLYKER
ncbi:MAG: hypothetical protein HYY78_14770 [Betaproteobacteria bacterium]|jgi:hypothetical protein|nr:hypothetical protein [Betaproteobacteria bacterium]